jgi:alpha-tubulin suppressor-like RCC1 family protein
VRGAGGFGRAAAFACLAGIVWAATAQAGRPPQVLPGRYPFNAALVFAYGFEAPSHILQGGQMHYGPNGEIDVDACRQPEPGNAACFARVRVDARALASRPEGVRGAVPALPAELGDGGAYSPAYLQSAYNAPSATAGAGRTVAIVDAFDNPHVESDLAVYRAHYGLPPCTTANGCFRRVDQSGGNTHPFGEPGWGLEIDLDVQMVSAICPKCHILLVEANDPSFESLTAAESEAVTLGATIVSNSWGGPEDPGDPDLDPSFDLPGVAVTVASGDFGFPIGPSYPATSPTVISVGGTSLQQATATGTRDATETAWEFAGSGCSIFEAKPSWQRDACPHRTSADVSAVADPSTPVWVFDTFTFGYLPNWNQIGGTSVAAPIVAALEALAGGPSSAAYAPEVSPYAHPGDFNDVTSGSTAACGNLLCEAGPGYDGPTGLGTPNGVAGFLPALPGAPENLKAGARDGAVVLSWDAPALNGGATVSSYHVYRSDHGSTPVATVAGDATSYDDTGLTNGHAYTYQVKAVTAVGESAAASVTRTPQPLDHLTLGPAGATLAAGGTRRYLVEGFATGGADLGDETAAATFSIDSDGSCEGASCGSEVAHDYTVTATVGGMSGTAVLHVVPGPVEAVKVAPGKATVPAHSSRTFTAIGYDRFGNAVGDETSKVVFGIRPNGSCAGSTCKAAVAGVHHVSAMVPATAVSSGWAGQDCAIASLGLECWGSNFLGQLGDGTFDDSSVPVPVAGLGGTATSVATGTGPNTCAVAGGVFCWGFDAYGVLGNSQARSSELPLQLPGLAGASKVSSSLSTCAIGAGGALECWGLNYYGQVGDGTTTDRWTPVPVGGLGAGVKDVSVGYLHTCAVTAAGGVKCWGNNWDGELGNGTFGAGDCNCLFQTPTDVSGLTHGVAAVTAGLEHTCALTTAGGVECWGDNQYGELGNGTTDISAVPVGVQGLASGVAQISAGVDFTCAVTTGGGVKCWGHGPTDSEGVGSAITAPEDVAGLSSGVASVTVGSDTACAVLVAGGVVCWQAGATSEAVPAPVDMAGTTGSVLKVGNCVVPGVVGKALRAAKRALVRAHCSVGKVRRAYSARLAAGRVLSQRPRRGRRLAFGAKVRLVVSRGRRVT